MYGHAIGTYRAYGPKVRLALKPTPTPADPEPKPCDIPAPPTAPPAFCSCGPIACESFFRTPGSASSIDDIVSKPLVVGLSSSLDWVPWSSPAPSPMARLEGKNRPATGGTK
jgi:hypothetical protein